MAWKDGKDPYPTIPNIEKPKIGIGDKIIKAIKGPPPELLKPEAPKMTPEQAQRAADLNVVHPAQRPDMNEILNTTDNTNFKIRN